MSVQIAPVVALGRLLPRWATRSAPSNVAAPICIHVDVMDGHFVPNITMGPLVGLRSAGSRPLPLDVHLMIDEPDRYIEAFVEAGAAMISVHAEVLPHLHRTVQPSRGWARRPAWRSTRRRRCRRSRRSPATWTTCW